MLLNLAVIHKHSFPIPTLEFRQMSNSNRFGLTIACLVIGLTLTNCTSQRPSLAGFSSPIYRTEADMTLSKVTRKGTTDDTIYVLRAGLKYQISQSKQYDVLIKILPAVNYSLSTVSPPPRQMMKQWYIDRYSLPPLAPIAPSGDGQSAIVYINTPKNLASASKCYPISKYQSFTVKKHEIEPYNSVIVNQVVLGAMVVPFKFRPATVSNGAGYRRQISGDLSVGAFAGYRFQSKGSLNKHFTTLGCFLGPSMVNYVNKSSQANSPNNGGYPDITVAFTAAVGLMQEINGFQVGILYGADRATGKYVADWQYDKKGWVSIGLGYNFLNGVK